MVQGFRKVWNCFGRKLILSAPSFLHPPPPTPLWYTHKKGSHTCMWPSLRGKYINVYKRKIIFRKSFMYQLARCSLCCCDPTDAEPEFLDSIQDVCVIMCNATVGSVDVDTFTWMWQRGEKNIYIKKANRISVFTLFPEKKQCTFGPGAVCYLLCLFLTRILFTGHWSVLMLTPVKHRAISSPSLPLKSESRWPTRIKVTTARRNK